MDVFGTFPHLNLTAFLKMAIFHFYPDMPQWNKPFQKTTLHQAA